MAQPNTWEWALRDVLGLPESDTSTRSDVTGMEWLVIKVGADADHIDRSDDMDEDGFDEKTSEKFGAEGLVLRFFAEEPDIAVFINKAEFVKGSSPWMRFWNRPVEEHLKPAWQTKSFNFAADPRTFHDAAEAFSRLRRWLAGASGEFHSIDQRMGGADAGWQGASAGAFRGVSGNLSEGVTDLLDQINGGPTTSAGERAYDVSLRRSGDALLTFIASLGPTLQSWVGTREFTPWGAIDTAMDRNLTYFDKGGVSTVKDWRTTHFGDLATTTGWRRVEQEAQRIWTENLRSTLDTEISTAASKLTRQLNQTISVLRPIRSPQPNQPAQPGLPGGDSVSTDPLNAMGADGAIPALSTGDPLGGASGGSVPDAASLATSLDGGPGGAEGAVPDLSGAGVSVPGGTDPGLGLGSTSAGGVGGDVQLPNVASVAAGVSVDPAGGSGGGMVLPGGVGLPGVGVPPSTVPGGGRRPDVSGQSDLPGNAVSVPGPELDLPGGGGAGPTVVSGGSAGDPFELPPGATSVDSRVLAAGSPDAGGTSQPASSGRFVAPDGTGASAGGAGTGASGGAGTGTSAVPFFPPMAGMGMGMGQQPQERERTTWLAEDEEVWGTDPQEAGPSVIGREHFDVEAADDTYPVDSGRTAPTRTRSRR